LAEKPDFAFRFKTHTGVEPSTITESRKTVQLFGERKPVVFEERFATTKIHAFKPTSERFRADMVRLKLRQMGILEELVIHEMDRDQFMKEKEIKWLGKGGEGTVFFLRGHVVKLVEAPHVPGTLREIAHLLFLNPLKSRSEGILGGRARIDFPSLIWIYVLNDGSLAIGMNCFDADTTKPGTTLDQRLRFGPPMSGDYVVRMLLELSKSLAYCHRLGLIHHDLKPSNIYLPGDPNMPPVVFDLGQALWNKTAWGKDWLKHEHNATYWYNGTFRYMHGERRRAHRAVLHYVKNRDFLECQRDWYRSYYPEYFDDVYAFGRILRDVGFSSYPCLRESEDLAIRDLGTRIMGYSTGVSLKPAEKSKGGAAWLTNVFSRKKGAPQATPVEEPRMSMEKVVTEIEKVLKTFEVVPPVSER
jgi:serine/threonine protein kinase